MTQLPIDALLPAIGAALAKQPNLVLTAEPGAGKTTRVPGSLLGPASSGRPGQAPAQIVVVEPRRLAARLSALRVADERGERIGGRIGYQVRFDERTSATTELSYVTEGILLRRLLSDRSLSTVRAVVLDEFHERSLQSDLLLACLRQLQREHRPGLQLIVMSATLDAEPVAAFLGDCAVVHAPGRLFPIDLVYAPLTSGAPLEDQVATAVRHALASHDGDVLVFLPGMAEIRRAAARLGELPGALVLPLHGSLSPEAQDLAVRPNALRKVILSTNVAETSITIDGVTAVIDSGVARVAGHSSWSGLPTLKVQKISRAAAAQRAGRAGRTRPGHAYRLYTQPDHDSRPAHEVPEIRRADLAEPLLLLQALGVGAPAAFPWFEAPPVEALAGAAELLDRLGAVREGALTELGARLAALPLHPRLSRVLLAGEARGVGREAAGLVALLQERELARPGEAESADSDPLWALERFEEAARDRFSPQALQRAGIDVGAAQAVARTAEQLVRRLTAGAARGPVRDVHVALRLSLLAGYPDRVARRRKPGHDELLLSGGGTARLSSQSLVKQAQLLIAIDAEEQRRPGESALGWIRSASAIEVEWLLDLFPERLREERRVHFNAEAERVDVDSQLWYDGLLLEDSRSPPTGDEMSCALATAALDRGPAAYASEGEPAQTLARVRFVREVLPELGLPPLGPDEVTAAVRALAVGRRRFAELREGNLIEVLLAGLTPSQRQALEVAAPGSVLLPGGRRALVHYEVDRPPWIEARLQDFFGWTEGPKLAKGRVPLTLHLLAPNKRAVQVTGDLSGFWQRHYPAIRKELMRRYPRHAWPEDPRRPLLPRSP